MGQSRGKPLVFRTSMALAVLRPLLLLARLCQAHEGFTVALPQQGALSAEATEVEMSCPASNFFSESFYVGATFVGAANETTLAECCMLCASTLGCEKWSYCPLDAETGCSVPAGPMAPSTFAAGACLLTRGLALDQQTLIVWDHTQPGVPWQSGEPTDGLPRYVESAAGSRASTEKLRFNSSSALFCRVVTAGPVQLLPLGASGAPGPTLMAGQEVGYAGLTLTDATGQELALVSSPSSPSFWLCPAASLGYCSAQRAGCAAGAAAAQGGGRAEQGASCQQDAQCCGGMLCLPRGVGAVQASYVTAGGGVARSPLFAVDSSNGTSSVGAGAGGGAASGLLALPKECAVPYNWQQAAGGVDTWRFDRPAADANGTALAWCLDWQASGAGADDAQCGDPAAVAFCTDQGFEDVADAAGPLAVQEPTLSPLTGAACDPRRSGQCMTFAYIVCGRPVADAAA